MRTKVIILLGVLFASTAVYAQQDTMLFDTPNGVSEVINHRFSSAIFMRSFKRVKAEIDAVIAEPILVPVPKDPGGGYTHEQHKSNYKHMYQAGLVYQITKDKKYVTYIDRMLLDYAALYPTLSLHPVKASSEPGRLFWQTLNESVWLVYTSIAYDCVREQIPAKDRAIIQKNVFYPMAEFIMQGTPNNKKTFNKMHNHGTWADTAVGLIGYTMGDKTLVDKALYGTERDGKGGFLLQLQKLFSPDGYYTEGPYYQRYAILPFVLFAQAINHYQPDLHIFQQRDSILLKAVKVLPALAYQQQFFLMNDALEKTLSSAELVAAFDIAYAVSKDPDFARFAMKQPDVLLSSAGFATAQEMERLAGEKAVTQQSVCLSDGPEGKQGAVAVLRHGASDGMCFVFKATSHGLSHGHFDKLSYSLFNHGEQLLTDYGAARFLNVASKSGGRYTTENKTYAKQTVAHNTLVVDQTSNFDGSKKKASHFAPHIDYVDITNPESQIVVATDSNAYASLGVILRRTVAMLTIEKGEEPVIIDLMMADAKDHKMHTYDLPFHYSGQLIATSFDQKLYPDHLSALGTDNGYQHLWKESDTLIPEGGNRNTHFTFLIKKHFYSVNTTTLSDMGPVEAMHLRIGANDPYMNLRPEPVMMYRVKNKANHQLFASVLTTHGVYDLVGEKTTGSQSIVNDLQVSEAIDGTITFKFKYKNKWIVFTQTNKENHVKINYHK